MTLAEVEIPECLIEEWNVHEWLYHTGALMEHAEGVNYWNLEVEI